VFCGTFTSRGLEVKVADRKLHIVNEGKVRKFANRLEQVSFSADRARRLGQEVLYVTERAVFRLGQEGIELIEVAPGVDLAEHVLDQMDFTPIIGPVRPMAEHVFE